MAVMRYDDSNLRKLYAALSPANRRKALKGAFRRAATYVRKAAVDNLRRSGIGNAWEMRKGIRQMVFRREAGFRVTAKARRASKNGKGGQGMHVTRTKKAKPILEWAESGTRIRSTKHKNHFIKGSRNPHPTGRMRPYRFMAATRRQVKAPVTEVLRNEIRENVAKIAKKYGCS